METCWCVMCDEQKTLPADAWRHSRIYGAVDFRYCPDCYDMCELLCHNTQEFVRRARNNGAYVANKIILLINHHFNRAIQPYPVRVFPKHHPSVCDKCGVFVLILRSNYVIHAGDHVFTWSLITDDHKVSAICPYCNWYYYYLYAKQKNYWIVGSEMVYGSH